MQVKVIKHRADYDVAMQRLNELLDLNELHLGGKCLNDTIKHTVTHGSLLYVIYNPRIALSIVLLGLLSCLSLPPTT